MTNISVAIGVLICGAVAFIVLDQIPSRSERNAENEICQSLATSVLAGKESAMSYMATRCSAKLLTASEAQ